MRRKFHNHFNEPKGDANFSFSWKLIEFPAFFPSSSYALYSADGDFRPVSGLLSASLILHEFFLNAVEGMQANLSASSKSLHGIS